LASFATVTRNSRRAPPPTGITAISGVIETESAGTTLTTFCFSPPTQRPS
jgi:hypothetical protein